MDAELIYTRLHHSYTDADHFIVRFFDCLIDVIVTRHEPAVLRWFSDLFRDYGPSFFQDPIAVAGLGLQWRPIPAPAPAGFGRRPATIQLCVGHRCLIFQIGSSSHIPHYIGCFLSDPRFVFFGWTNNADRRRLSAHYGLQVVNGRELMMPFRWSRSRSVDYVVKHQLGYSGMGMQPLVGRSAWDAPVLNGDQVQYATLDAYLAFRVGFSCLHRFGFI